MKTKMIAVLIALVVLAGVGSAALLDYFATIEEPVSVDQSLLVDGGDWEGAHSEPVNLTAGEIIPGPDHDLVNMIDQPNRTSPMIVVDFAQIDCTSDTGDCIGFTVYEEFKLDATADCTLGEDYHADDDDSIVMVLDNPMTWSNFTRVDFEYLIGSGANHTPQMNIKLVDSEGNFGGYVTWHAKWLNRLGTVGTYETLTNFKNVGDITALCPNGGIPCTRCFAENWDIVPCDNIAGNLTFDRFSINVGDTSYCNDKPNAWGGAYGNAEQIVYISKIELNNGGMPIALAVPPIADKGTLRGTVDFRMMYGLDADAVPGTYTQTVEIDYLGTA